MERVMMRTAIAKLASVGMAVFLPLGLAAQEPAARLATASDPPKQATAKPSSALLEVRGEVARPLALSAEEFAKLPRQTVKARGHDGVESEYEGVPLIQVLGRAGVPTGAELKGKELTRYVVVEAADGYRVNFSLAELDAAFTDRVVLLADRRDGRRLTDREGPLQVIVPGEKKHARWVRQVTRLVGGRA
jgi:DMSO/TMAO reductase YedYZ molybdopterin-dependent catalytic subunit